MSTVPLRIHAVALLTGVPEPTIRAWERRYGVPRPRRTESGYRLYGTQDVAAVERMRDLCARGVAAAEAAIIAMAEPDDALAESPLVAQMVDATATMDAHDLDAVLGASVHLGSARVMVETVLAPALRRMGELWEKGELTVAHEHFASERITAHLRSLLRLRETRRSRPRVIVASYAEDQHVLATLAIALVASEIVEAVVLGSRTPPEAVAAAVRTVGARGVLLSTTIGNTPKDGRALANAYGRACKGIPWLVGGAAAPSQRKSIEGAGGLVAQRGLEDVTSFVSRL